MKRIISLLLIISIILQGSIPMKKTFNILTNIRKEVPLLPMASYATSAGDLNDITGQWILYNEEEPTLYWEACASKNSKWLWADFVEEYDDNTYNIIDIGDIITYRVLNMMFQPYGPNSSPDFTDDNWERFNWNNATQREVPSEGFYYEWLRTAGIPYSNFKNSFNYKSNYYNLLLLITMFITQFELWSLKQFDKWSRNPGPGDLTYKPDFNMGYEWKWYKSKIEYIGSSNKTIISGNREDQFYKDSNTRLKKFNSVFYPGKFDIPEQNIEQGGYLFHIRILLNGKYWTYDVTESMPILARWRSNSYCWSYVDGTLNIYKDSNGAWHSNTAGITWHGPYNCGSSYDIDYKVDQIPAGYRISEFEEEESS